MDLDSSANSLHISTAIILWMKHTVGSCCHWCHGKWFFLKSDLKINSSSYCAAAAAAGAIPPTLKSDLPFDLWHLPAERYFCLCVDRQCPRCWPSGSWRLWCLWGGAEWWRAHEGGHLPAVFCYSQERGQDIFNKQRCFVKVSSLSPAFKTNFRVSAFAAVSTWAAVTHHPWREQTRGTAPWATSAAPYLRMTGPLPSPHWPAASTLWSVVLISTRPVAVLKPSRSCHLRVSFTPHRTLFFPAPFLIQVPFYRGERITFDVAPSRMDFKVEHNSLKLEVKSLMYRSIRFFFFAPPCWNVTLTLSYAGSSPYSASWAFPWRAEFSTARRGKGCPMPRYPSTIRLKVTASELWFQGPSTVCLTALFCSSQSPPEKTVLSGWRTWQLAPIPSAWTRSSCSLSRSQWRLPPAPHSFLTSSQQGAWHACCFICAFIPDDPLQFFPQSLLAYSGSDGSRLSTASASVDRSPSAACLRAWSSRDAIKWLWNTRTQTRPPGRPSTLTRRVFSAFRPNLETTASM